MMRTLRLVQLPVPPPAAFASTGNVPLAAGCLGVAARVHGLENRLAIEVVPPALTDTLGDTRLAEHIAFDEPEFVGFSLYLWNVERGLYLAREVKRHSPRTTILIGGPEVSADNPFVLRQAGFDIAVTGEAEPTFAALMERLLDGRDPTGLPGVAVRGAEGLGPFGPAPSAGFPLTEYPSPYLEGLVAVEPARSTYIETVRGCRSHCTFCFYPRSSNVLRALDVERSAALVAALKERGARDIVFLDPTFNHRSAFVPLLDALAAVNADRSLTFFAEVRAEGLTADHAARLAKAGFTTLEIGLQSVNVQTLKRIRRGGHPDKVAAAAQLLHAEGITLLVDLIVGLPGDTPDDVARGVDFLLVHDLADAAQIFPLALLPGTAMRADAERDGIIFDPSPPYRVIRTSTMSEDAWREALFDAETRLGRRIDEYPRPLLIDCRELPDPPDVFVIDLDREDRLDHAEPGARHVALWFRGEDLHAHRNRIARVLDARLAVDPYATLDVILCPRRPFPLSLLDRLRVQLNTATPSYLSRMLAHRGEDLQRRLAVVLPQGAALPPDFLAALLARVPVFRDQPAYRAVADARALGRSLPGARILDKEIDRRSWNVLREQADPEAVAFAARRLEVAWQQGVLGYSETGEREESFT
jgi:hypothetical protein